MIGKVYIHTKTGNEYLVLDYVDMKCPQTGQWLEAILYEPFILETEGRVYVRAKESFQKSFVEKAGQ